MNLVIGFAYVSVESLLLGLAFLAILRIGFFRLESSLGIARDGIPPGKTAPPWSLLDIEGHLRISPASTHWQLLVFADHSLASFPDLMAGINQVVSTARDLEVVVLSCDSQDLCEATIRSLDLHAPIVPVDQTFYDNYLVRVMPFVFLLDSRGIIRWVSLVNTQERLSHALQTMTLQTAQSDHSKGGR